MAKSVLTPIIIRYKIKQIWCECVYVCIQCMFYMQNFPKANIWEKKIVNWRSDSFELGKAT